MHFSKYLLMCSFCFFVTHAYAETQVSIQGKKLIYEGDITQDANIRTVKLLEQNSVIKTLYINSLGGDIGVGVDLGNLIYDHQLNIEVGKYCFSSCANYVFTAGHVKYLNIRSQLGWHGGSLQKMDDSDIDTPEKKQEYLNYIGPIQQKEVAFFKRVKTQQLMTILGQQPQYKNYDQCAGWRYTLKKMKSLGVENIRYKQGVWLPKSSFKGACIFTISE